MTKQEVIDGLRGINSEWAGAYSNEDIDFEYLRGADTLAQAVLLSMMWPLTKKGTAYWSYVYDELKGTGK